MRGFVMSVPSGGWRGRGTWLATTLIAVALLVAGLLVGPFGGVGHAAASPVTVSLTFDDSNADQLPAEQTMQSLGLHGTFYTVSGWVGMPSYLTLANLQQIAADGNEIAGHTIEHPDLPTLDPQEQMREICNDRVNLINWGFQPTDFAYPFADADTNETDAAACGYNSARGLGDVVSPGDCSGCVFAETMPPPDPFYLRAPDEVDASWTLAQMEQEVTNAQNNGGGWVILTFHHICSDIGAADCPSDLSTTPARASSAAPAGIKVIGAVSPITAGAKAHVHSHARPLIPGAGKVKPHQRFAVPEPSPGPHAKSNT
jgi:peptidoglycan/xylan/chitin deacetylase (PgdA/CDA1 family)